MTNYDVGDKVKKKGEIQAHTRPFIFLGNTANTDLTAIKNVKDIMGDSVEIGIFAAHPSFVEQRTDGWGYCIPVILASTDLFEKSI